MAAGILVAIGVFLTHNVPGIGPFLGAATDTVAAILQIIARGTIG